MTLAQLQALYNSARTAMLAANDAIAAAPDTIDADGLAALERTFQEAEADVRVRQANLQAQEARERAVGNFHAIEITPDAPEARGGSVPIPGTRVDATAPRTYNRETSHERSFCADMYASQYGTDMSARERLDRNAREIGLQRRDVAGGNTGNYTGLVIPQYLVDLFAPYLRAGRVFANEVRHLPLPPEGMVFNISTLTTQTTTAIQATENAQVSAQVADDTLLAVNVRTIAGEQNVSRQLLERGTPGIDELLYQDLLSDYAMQLDVGAINGAGTGGTIKGVLNSSPASVTYTDASPTVPELWPKVANAVQTVASTRFKPATKIFMHPRRWGWMLAALDSSNRPLVVPNSMAMNAAGEQGAFGEGAVGTLQGLPVFVDANIPANTGAGTNQDTIIVTKADDLLLWEEGDGTPRQARFEQTLGNQLTIKLVVYGYVAFTAERYTAATAAITGTGLVTPTF